jgi:hypothetical protein
LNPPHAGSTKVATTTIAGFFGSVSATWMHVGITISAPVNGKSTAKFYKNGT